MANYDEISVIFTEADCKLRINDVHECHITALHENSENSKTLIVIRERPLS